MVESGFPKEVQEQSYNQNGASMKRIASLSCLIILFTASLHSQEWVVSVVDSPGIRPNIAVDSQGVPHIVYFDFGFGGSEPRFDTTHVMYAIWNPESEAFESESTLQSAVHPFADFILDQNDSPHFVFHWHNPPDATYTTYNGTNWVQRPIPSDGHDGFGPSIILDADGHAHVSFINGRSIDDPDGVGIEYGFFDGADWTVETVGTEPELSHHSGTSIGLNTDGSPSIAYYDSVAKALMFATRESGGWSIDVVDDVGDPGRFSSMQFDSQGYPRIAYLDLLSKTSGIVRLATMTTLGWTFQDLDTLYSILVSDSASTVRSRAPVGVEGLISLVLDSADQVHVAYSDSHKVTLASVNGPEVTKETVFEFAPGEGGALGMTTSLALDSDDRPHIAFYFDYGDSVGTCLYARKEGVVSAISNDDVSQTPETTVLIGNYPNPFNPSTTIRYGLSQPGLVSLRVYNILGQLVRTIVDEHQLGGYHEAVWDGRNEVGATVASGIYVYRMTAASFVETRRMLLVK